MNKLIRFTAFLTIALGLIAHPALAQTNAAATSLAPMLKKVLPAIVNIRVQEKERPINPFARDDSDPQNHQDQLPPNGKLFAMASGVIIDSKNGYIVTNAHVIKNSKTIIVTLKGGRHYTAKLVGEDDPADIALLKISAKDLVAIPITDSNNLKVGDYVTAIGNPFGLDQTVTSGIVSALGRTTLGIESYENFIQTDAPINPGNSGGALVNMKGELVGINTAILAPNKGSIGIGFAIPANMMKNVINQLIKFGDVQRGTLGIIVQNVTPDINDALKLHDQKGALVGLVIPESPASKAGFKVGDIITKVGTSKVKSSADLINTIGFLRVNSAATFSILRQGKNIRLTAELISPQEYKKKAMTKNPFLFGLSLKNISVFTPSQGKIQGIMVLDVDEDTNAWHADLRPGDVILSANSKSVTNIKELQDLAKKNSNHLMLNVLRGPGGLFIVINKE